MSFCKNCLMPVDEDTTICSNCGADLSLTEKPVYNQPNEPVQPYVPPEPQVTVERVPAYTVLEKEDLHILAKIGLLFLAIAMAPIGLTVGIVMMSGREKTYKAIGQIMVIVSVIVIVSITLCCCAVYFASFTVLQEYGGYFY